MWPIFLNWFNGYPLNTTLRDGLNKGIYVLLESVPQAGSDDGWMGLDLAGNAAFEISVGLGLCLTFFGYVLMILLILLIL